MKTSVIPTAENTHYLLTTLLDKLLRGVALSTREIRYWALLQHWMSPGRERSRQTTGHFHSTRKGRLIVLRSQDVIGSSVITHDTGDEIGSVKDVIVHRIKKSVLGFLVRRPGWFQHLSVLPFSEAMSFSDAAVVVRTKDSLLSFHQAADAVPHVDRKPLPGTTLITTAGNELGQIVDFAFDEKSGELTGLDVFLVAANDGSNPRFLPLDEHLFIGKYDVMVSESATDHPLPETKEFSYVDSPTTKSQAVTPQPAAKQPNEPAAPTRVPTPSRHPVLESFRIINDGASLTVNFDDFTGLDELCIARLREQLLRMLAANSSCKTVRFDVTNLKLLPSVMLGLLASLRKQVGKLEVLNPSKDVYEVLKMMSFDKLFDIRNLPT